MAITLSTAQLLAALRMADSPEETAEAERLLSYATAAISKHLGDAYRDTPEAVLNEGCVRLAGYLFDQPFTARGQAFAAAMTNSGAGSILLPYRRHTAGSIREAT